MYDIKAFYQACTPREAVTLLTEHKDAIIIAGGSDVLIQIREGRLAGAELVSIYGIEELRQIQMRDDETLCIGALTSFSHVATNPYILERIPVLADAVLTIGGPQIRNIGTVGGNTCNGVTSADSAATLMAYDAQMEILGQDGIRTVPIREFYVSAGKTVLAYNEILLAITISKHSYENRFGHYYKYAMRNAMDIATSTCSVNLRLSEDKQNFDDVRIAYGVAGPVPTRAPKAEAFLSGKPVTKETIERVATEVIDELRPRDSWRASKALRAHILEQMTKASLIESTRKAGGAI